MQVQQVAQHAMASLWHTAWSALSQGSTQLVCCPAYLLPVIASATQHTQSHSSASFCMSAYRPVQAAITQQQAGLAGKLLFQHTASLSAKLTVDVHAALYMPCNALGCRDGA
jgi:hypothetical protein